MLDYRIANSSVSEGMFSFDLALGVALRNRYDCHAEGCAFLKSMIGRYGNRSELQSAMKSCKDVTAAQMAYFDGSFDSLEPVATLRRMPTADHLYKIESSSSHLVLDVAASSPDDGAAVIQYAWHGTTNQTWRLTPLDDGTYRIECVSSGKCLNVPGSSQDNGAEIIQWPFEGSDNERWYLVPVADGFVIQAKHSHKVLDDPGASPDEGKRIIQYDRNGAINQSWSITPVD